MQSWVNLYGLASARIDVHRRTPFRSGATERLHAPGPEWHNGWNKAWEYTGDTTNGVDYTLISRAKDGIASAITGGLTADFDCDIIFTGGQFFQWPQGTQT